MFVELFELSKAPRARRILRAVLVGGIFTLLGHCLPETSLLAASDNTEDAPIDQLVESSQNEDIKLYQLLYDYHFTEPLSTLGQTVRILIWIRYLEFTTAQQQLLLNLAHKFKERSDEVFRQEDLIIRNYEAKLEPLFRSIHDALSATVPDETKLDTLARELNGINLVHRHEDEFHTLRARAVRTILADQENFLHTLSPDQEERLVTSLFFLRKEIDPFANPETYRKVIGPTWNAGDFTPLLRQKRAGESNLNIGGLWGLEEDREAVSDVNFSDIRRPLVLFYVLKEPALILALEENLARLRGSSPDKK